MAAIPRPRFGNRAEPLSTMKAFSTIPVLLFAPLVLARADILLPGYKRVQHLVEFTNISVFTNCYFFVHPRARR